MSFHDKESLIIFYRDQGTASGFILLPLAGLDYRPSGESLRRRHILPLPQGPFHVPFRSARSLVPDSYFSPQHQQTRRHRHRLHPAAQLGFRADHSQSLDFYSGNFCFRCFNQKCPYRAKVVAEKVIVEIVVTLT